MYPKIMKNHRENNNKLQVWKTIMAPFFLWLLRHSQIRCIAYLQYLTVPLQLEGSFPHPNPFDFEKGFISHYWQFYLCMQVFELLIIYEKLLVGAMHLYLSQVINICVCDETSYITYCLEIMWCGLLNQGWIRTSRIFFQ